MNDLQAEVKLLQWHKIANEAAIQTALMRTRAIRQEESRMRPILEKSQRSQRKERLMRAKDDENRKPLEVTTEITSRHEEENRRCTLADEKRKQILEYQQLKSKQKQDERSELKSRNDYCRNVKSSLNKNEVIN